ncbi:hypothetical protein OJAV_G00196110 [Oryzias javanicus]|uniref:Uncharacterized protein n=1 Tax=Oryzias javanicus TaxID=123683 RepID=A0A3S2NSZ5_ORYJA|nr:hypothetical protein OJAV_G00196110 [Oryzias javanicus]
MRVSDNTCCVCSSRGSLTRKGEGGEGGGLGSFTPSGDLSRDLADAESQTVTGMYDILPGRITQLPRSWVLMVANEELAKMGKGH